ncbi:Uncharacterised protein [Legionella pneumophila]|uniref:hypothetical protein n=1 Tax=Legionellaceae TaxID=444 RepID=UPI00039EC9CE|nr:MULTISPECIES: hypothetical protein [Legionellaceae]MCW8385024.1 hypothetical protein [Fluoribacter dumoffii]MCW8465085.1 hypothetical protein [Legionella pneumophila]MDO5172940.1 hypothetical protein [Legionella pneumophila]MDO5213427.1 hypothetical protein [Legionella pneumophila]MDO5279069.1 hypothetical protein [Legionella pneumophila]
MSFFKTVRVIGIFIGLVSATFFLNSCNGAVKQGSQEVEGGYGGHSAGGHGGHGGAGH